MANRQLPCPYRIVEDFGSGFSMGCVAGCLMYFVRGWYYAPKQQKFYGGVMLLKKRAPILGGSFALWAGLFSITDCTLIGLRNKQDAANQIVAGAITGGMLAFRAGARVAFKNAIFGGMILGCMSLFEVMMIKMNKRAEMKMQEQMAAVQNQNRRRQLAKMRPDLFMEKGENIIPRMPVRMY